MTDGEILNALYERVGHAREEHDWKGTDKTDALQAIVGEVVELVIAVATESRERQVDEALDVIATCFRFCAGEHDHDD